MDKQISKYEVTMRFQHPAWDEREGIIYKVRASSKSEAVKRARRQSEDDGHTGRRFYTAVEVEDIAECGFEDDF